MSYGTSFKLEEIDNRIDNLKIALQKETEEQRKNELQNLIERLAISKENLKKNQNQLNEEPKNYQNFFADLYESYTSIYDESLFVEEKQQQVKSILGDGFKVDINEALNKIDNLKNLFDKGFTR